jgi:hypothetical protein
MNPAQVSALTQSFEKLLDASLPEQKYQAFLEENPALIPREFVQNHGVHFNLVFRKLSLAKDYTTDFFYLAKSSADWHCILVEIEKPSSKYFKNGSSEFHPDFLKALAQINRWRAWFENLPNKEGFINGTIRPVRVPPKMTRNPCFIKYVLVHGRRDEYEDNEVRAGLIRGQERNDDFHILSYDSLIEDLHDRGDLYIAVRHNELIDIVSTRFVSEALFAWVDSSYIRIKDALKADILKNKDRWHHHSTKGSLLLEQVLPKLRTI